MEVEGLLNCLEAEEEEAEAVRCRLRTEVVRVEPAEVVPMLKSTIVGPAARAEKWTAVREVEGALHLQSLLHSDSVTSGEVGEAGDLLLVAGRGRDRGEEGEGVRQLLERGVGGGRTRCAFLRTVAGRQSVWEGALRGGLRQILWGGAGVVVVGRGDFGLGLRRGHDLGVMGGLECRARISLHQRLGAGRGSADAVATAHGEAGWGKDLEAYSGPCGGTAEGQAVDLAACRTNHPYSEG